MNKYIKTYFMPFVVLISSTLMLTACLDQGGKTSGDIKPVLMMSVTTFKDPESVTYDKKRDRFYVSQVNMAEKYGGGAVSVVSSGGQISELGWIEGLNNPKGLAVYQDKLYVADGNNLIEVDIEAGKIARKYYGAGSASLESVTIDEQGTIYVTDILGDKIYRLEQGGGLQVWLSDDKLETPNGILVHDGALYVASYGKIASKNFDSFSDAPPGKVLKINLTDKSIMPLTKDPVGHLDGIVSDGKGGVYVSDWQAGKLFLIKLEDGTVVKTYDMAKVLGIESAQGLANIAYVKDKQQLWAPMMLSGSVLVLSLADVRGSS